MVRTGDRIIELYGAQLRAAKLQPRSFEESVRRYLEAYAKENPAAEDPQAPDFLTRMLFPPESGVSAPVVAGRRLSIRPVTGATGTWAIVDATTGLPVPSGPNGMRQTIGLRDLLAFEQRTQAAEQDVEAKRLADIVRQQAKDEEEKARKAPTIPFPITEPAGPRSATGGTIPDVPRILPAPDGPAPDELLGSRLPDIRMRQPERRPPLLTHEWWRGGWGTEAEEWGLFPRERKPQLPNPPRRGRRRRRSEREADE
jgi:hypothetical protein